MCVCVCENSSAVHGGNRCESTGVNKNLFGIAKNLSLSLWCVVVVVSYQEYSLTHTVCICTLKRTIAAQISPARRPPLRQRVPGALGGSCARHRWFGVGATTTLGGAADWRRTFDVAGRAAAVARFGGSCACRAAIDLAPASVSAAFCIVGRAAAVAAPRQTPGSVRRFVCVPRRFGGARLCIVLRQH